MQRKAIKETPLSTLRLKLAETQFKCTLSKWGGGLYLRARFVSVYTETGNRKKWELGGLVKLEATVCSSFGSQHNERALSDMNTSLHGKLKVVSLPKQLWHGSVSNCASIMRLSLLSLLKQNQLYHFKVAIHFPSFSSAHCRRCQIICLVYIKTKRLIQKLIIVIQFKKRAEGGVYTTMQLSI